MNASEAATELLRREMGAESAAGFALAIDVPGRPSTPDEDAWIFEPIETQVAAHHLLFLATADRLIRGELGTNNLMVFAPPGSAKSSYMSVVLPAYVMGKYPGHRVIATSYATDLALKMSRRTRQIARSEKFSSLFTVQDALGHEHPVMLTPGNASVEEWSMTNGSEYMASGLTAGLTGNRADLLVIDDPVSGREDADSVAMRKKTRNAYEEDAMTRLKPNGKTVIVQTRWHQDDLSGGILPENWVGESGLIDCRDGQKWFVLCIPAIADRTDDPLGRPIGEPLWREWFTPEHFAKFRGNKRTWSALFQQKPVPGEGADFQKHWLQYYVKPPRLMNKVILVDPSSGRKGPDKDNDYTSVWVIGLASDKNVYVLDGLRDRLNLKQRVDALLKLHRRHNSLTKGRVLQVRYEQYGMQADVEAIRMIQEHEQYRFKITEVGGPKSKADRIRRLVPLFQNGLIWLPHTLGYTDVDGVQHDVVKEFLEQEYGAFPVARHDDMLDALARMVDSDIALPFPEEADDIVADAFGVLDAEIGY